MSKKKLEVKMVMLGKSTVGKTTIAIRLSGGNSKETSATVGATFIMANRGNIKYNIWDTGGQDRFRCLMPMYIRDSKIAMFVFDATNVGTLDELDSYVIQLEALNKYHIIVVGNKTDLLTDDQLANVVEITDKKINNSILKDKVYGISFTSAKTGENFDSFLGTLNMCANLYKNDVIDTNKVKDVIILSNQQSNNPPVHVENEDGYCAC